MCAARSICGIFGGTAKIQQLVISRAISGMGISQASAWSADDTVRCLLG